MSEKSNIKQSIRINGPKPRLKLIAARKASGMSHREIAKAIGCHHQTLIKYENGFVTLSEERAGQLAKVFGCRAWELIDDAPDTSGLQASIMQLAAGLSDAAQRDLLEYARRLQAEAAQAAAPPAKKASSRKTAVSPDPQD